MLEKLKGTYFANIEKAKKRGRVVLFSKNTSVKYYKEVIEFISTNNQKI